MATGDATDFAARLLAVLPSRWFPSVAPVLNGVLMGIGTSWATIYTQIQYVILQTRVATATGAWVDGISQDFNAGTLPRLANETDAAFITRIRANFFAPKVTRAGVILALTNLTGNAPWVFEPANTGDTKGYGAACGYNIAGGYGNLNLPFSFFVTAYRTGAGGIAGVDGYGGSIGGYGTGAIEYASQSMVQGSITDATVQNAINNTIPVGTTAWMNITTPIVITGNPIPSKVDPLT